MAVRLQRFCNRQDVLLLNNRFLLLYTRDSLAVTLKGSKEFDNNEMQRNEFTNTDKKQIELMSK